MKVAGFTVLALVALAATAFAYEPTSNYTIQDIEGWKVYVNNGLLGEGKSAEVGAEALKKLKKDLATMKKWISEGPLKELVKVPIWLEVDTTNGPHGKTPVFHYHPYKDWLEEMDFNPEKHQCVEFSRVADYVAAGDRSVRTVLHELAHGYHDRVLGFDDPEILAAYKRAVEGKAYPRRDWARIDEKEFFCAVTERYFGSEKERAQLKERDPDVVKLLKRVWGEPRAVPEASAAAPGAPGAMADKPAAGSNGTNAPAPSMGLRASKAGGETARGAKGERRASPAAKCGAPGLRRVSAALRQGGRRNGARGERRPGDSLRSSPGVNGGRRATRSWSETPKSADAPSPSGSA